MSEIRSVRARATEKGHGGSGDGCGGLNGRQSDRETWVTLARQEREGR